MKNENLYSTHKGPLVIGGWVLNCHVLNDKKRVITQRAFLDFFGIKTKSGYLEALKAPLQFAINKSTKSQEALLKKIVNPIVFKNDLNIQAYGYEGSTLVEFCRAVLNARKGKFQHNASMAQICEDLLLSIADIGIIALIDEATGYQEVRDKRALESLLDKILGNRLGAWAKRFPDDFYINLFRLKGWKWNEITKKNKPGVVGKWTRDIVYARIAPHLIEELEGRNPIKPDGKREVKHHQFMTEDVGHPLLRDHLLSVIVLMKSSITWDSFYAKLQRVFPIANETLMFDFEEGE